MNLKDTIHTLFGVGDGEGNTSLMRVILLLVVLTVLVPKVVVAIRTAGAVTFDSNDLGVLGLSFGAKLFQNAQEAKPQPKTP